VDPAAVRRSYADAEPRPFWLSQPDAPEPGAPLEGVREADLVVVGGGLTGLWAALLAKEEEPGREVVLLEGERIAFGATGRNGGFMNASLTHGIENRVSRWPEEMPRLERLGRAEAWGAERARQEVHSPTYHGAAHLPDGRGTIDPARLAWGLARAAAARGSRRSTGSGWASTAKGWSDVAPRGEECRRTH
jgi:glycine/D-amino acid oxidase-like deaminating enzyme